MRESNDSGGLLVAVDLHHGLRRLTLGSLTLLADALEGFPHVGFAAGDVAERPVENAFHDGSVAGPAFAEISGAWALVTPVTARTASRHEVGMHRGQPCRHGASIQSGIRPDRGVFRGPGAAARRADSGVAGDAARRGAIRARSALWDLRAGLGARGLDHWQRAVVLGGTALRPSRTEAHLPRFALSR